MNILDLKTTLTNIREKYDNQLHQRDLEQLDKLIAECDEHLANGAERESALAVTIIDWVLKFLEAAGTIADLWDKYGE